ncbi:MAG: uracil-DNA glycosylase family protein [Candidatus Dormibacteria bacterium]
MPEPDLPSNQSPQERLDRVAGEVRSCTRCRLHRTRTQGVPGVGPASARLMAIGEAPGEREDLAGEPFVGAAGQLLTQLLEGIGLSRKDIFITNVLKSRPPNNRDPLPDEVAACAGYLDAQIEAIRPQVILLLGRHALQRLLPGAPGISRCHGRVLQQGERSYMPCYHPAAALYNGSLLQVLRQDFSSLRRHLDSIPAGAPTAGIASPEQLGLFGA